MFLTPGKSPYRASGFTEANQADLVERRFSEPLLISVPLLPRGLKYRLHANCTLRRVGERCTGESAGALP
jgi:hypothetical protein